MHDNNPLEFNTLKRILALVYFFICFSPFVFSQDLGERIDLSETKAAKGLKFSICPPKGWLVQEGKNPNVTIEFVDRSSGDSFNVTVTYGSTFISKKEFAKMEDEIVEAHTKQTKELYDIFLTLDHKMIKIDDYAFIRFTSTGYFNTDATGLTSCRSVVYIGCIEDLCVTLTGMDFGFSPILSGTSLLFERVAKSISFYEQYDYINTARP